MPVRFDIRHCDTARRDDGVVLLTIGRGTRAIQKQATEEWLLGIDPRGEMVVETRFDFNLMDCRRTSDNTLLVMGNLGHAQERSLDGKVLNEWYCAERFPDGHPGVPLATPKIHHALCDAGDGLIASVSIEQLPAPKPSEEWTHTMADTIVLFDRAGKIHFESSLADILDINRESHDSTIPYWPYQGWDRTRDWTHANSIIVDPTDNNFLISLRHQEAIIKVNRNGELIWILGDDTGWTGKWRDKLLRIKGGRPFYHQHDVSFTNTGDLMLFDNGTTGSMPPNARQPVDQGESFVLCYRIDEAQMTATETWRFGGFKKGRQPGPSSVDDTNAPAPPASDCILPFSVYVSGVCEMANGNRFVACTGITRDESGNHRVELPPQGVGYIELFEVTPDKDIVFHAVLDDPKASIGEGWAGFRPEYVPASLAGQLKR